ncbi:MAG: hypothetical protein H7Y20_16860 [Bryobacteraceae bacterium]|nr:hypothetical protein [Bryobacteraceae bacterium]
MRITDTSNARLGWERSDLRLRPAAANADQPRDHVVFAASSSPSLPDMLKLTSPDHPQRESFLTALAETMRAGLHVTDTSAVAGSILRRGFDSVGYGL